MGRSQETFGKKENEKKKKQKKREKEQKKEERKTTSNKGKSLDDMMAYVDEFGNITSTPPDANLKKKEINVEDIQIGISKQVHVDLTDVIFKGSVTFFNESKGYGFIKNTETQESVFVHLNGLVDQIKENDKVTFKIEMGQKGPNAVDVKIVVKEK